MVDVVVVALVMVVTVTAVGGLAIVIVEKCYTSFLSGNAIVCIVAFVNMLFTSGCWFWYWG